MRWTAPLLLTLGVLTFLVALATGPIDTSRAIVALLGVIIAAWGMVEWEWKDRTSPKG